MTKEEKKAPVNTIEKAEAAVKPAKHVSAKHIPAKHVPAVHVLTTFEFERGQVLSNLTLLEDHAQEFPCPYCMEKHLSKLIGYSEEIAEGSEGDEKTFERLAEDMRIARSEIVKFKGKKTPDSKYAPYVDVFRTWRRKLQGVAEHSHESAHISPGK